MNSKQQLSIGIIGSGGMANHRAERFSSLEGCQLKAVASRNRETGHILAQKYSIEYIADWQELISREDIDAVVICTHNDSHGEIAVAALEQDKHVFMEYPLARDIAQGERAVALAQQKRKVLRLTHAEYVSQMHERLRQIVQEHGPLRVAMFTRLTPGRGARPEILFNLNISGPPALFFIYHVHPVIDLFGPVEWVEGGAEYEMLDEHQSYLSFVNTVNVRFCNGGLGQWLWAGGIEIQTAEEYRRYVLAKGTLIEQQGRFLLSKRSGIEELNPLETDFPSLEELFLQDIAGEETKWLNHAEIALQAIRVSLTAEQSMLQNKRVFLTKN